MRAPTNKLILIAYFAAVGWLVYRSGGSGAFGAEDAQPSVEQQIVDLQHKLDLLYKHRHLYRVGLSQAKAQGLEERQATLLDSISNSDAQIRQARAELAALGGENDLPRARRALAAAAMQLAHAEATYKAQPNNAAKRTLNAARAAHKKAKDALAAIEDYESSAATAAPQR